LALVIESQTHYIITVSVKKGDLQMTIYFTMQNGDTLKYTYDDYTYDQAMLVVDELLDTYGADCTYEIV